MTSYISLINLLRIMYHHTITMNHFVFCATLHFLLYKLTNERIDIKSFVCNLLNSSGNRLYAYTSSSSLTFHQWKIKQTKQIYYWQWDKYMYQLPITHRLPSQKKVHKENEVEWKDVVLCFVVCSMLGFIFLASSLNSLVKQNKL